MEGLIGTIENWYFEKHNKSFIDRLNETWKNIDNKKLKVHDRIYFSCTEEWEVDTLRDKIMDKYPSYSEDEVNNAIQNCCKSEKAPYERFAFENLIKRREIIKKRSIKIKQFSLTDLGKELSRQKVEKLNLIETLTPDLLKSGGWQNKQFRQYDVKINVPQIFAGRKQEYRKFLDDVRNKFLSLGLVS